MFREAYSCAVNRGRFDGSDRCCGSVEVILGAAQTVIVVGSVAHLPVFRGVPTGLSGSKSTRVRIPRGIPPDNTVPCPARVRESPAVAETFAPFPMSRTSFSPLRRP